jgi:hypothetical protein
MKCDTVAQKLCRKLLPPPHCPPGSSVVIVCAQATCIHLMNNWSDYMSYCYKKCDGYRLS